MKALAFRVQRVLRRQAERDPVLAQIVAHGQLAAEAVPSMLDRHLPGVVREGMDQHGHAEVG
jgi:hypothetical protein